MQLSNMTRSLFVSGQKTPFSFVTSRPEQYCSHPGKSQSNGLACKSDRCIVSLAHVRHDLVVSLSCCAPTAARSLMQINSKVQQLQHTQLSTARSTAAEWARHPCRVHHTGKHRCVSLWTCPKLMLMLLSFLLLPNPRMRFSAAHRVFIAVEGNSRK